LRISLTPERLGVLAASVVNMSSACRKCGAAVHGAAATCRLPRPRRPGRGALDRLALRPKVAGLDSTRWKQAVDELSSSPLLM
jgi:ribosomal protein L40E